MAIVIVLGLVLAMVVMAYFDFRNDPDPDGRRSCSPPLDDLEGDLDPEPLDMERLRRDLTAVAVEGDFGNDATPTTRSEADEASLTRRLIAGTIEPSTYRRLMGELAHGSTWSGGRQ